MADVYLPLIGGVESPANNIEVQNILNITGWALDGAGVNAVYVYIDGIKHDIPYGLSRPDIYARYPQYQSQNCGYNHPIDVSNFVGNKLVRIEVVGKSGKVIASSEMLIKRDLKSFLYEIENISENITLGKNKNISGWVLSNNEIEYIKAEIDNISIPIVLEIERNDIHNRFPTYQNLNCGWEVKSSSISQVSGKHSFKLIIKEKNKTEYVKTINFTVPLYQKIYEVESPIDTGKINDFTLVRGFYISDKNLKSISVSIGNKITKSGRIDVYREDILNDYPDYANSNSGWEVEIDTTSLPYGTYNMAVEFTDNDNTKSVKNLSVKRATTPWFDEVFQGDVPSKEILLDEIKANLVDVINDYRGLGIENEDILISNVLTLFTREIIPDRRDWNILVETLKELATVKERGQEYKEFINDLDDGLGVTDLYKIKEFINYIQELGPIDSNLSMILEIPEKYNMKNISHNSNDNYKKTITLNWDVNDIVVKKGTINYDKNPVEDVNSYNFIIDSGSFHKEIVIPPNVFNPINLNLEWHKWFNPSNVNHARVELSHYVLDKRGNSNGYNSVIKNYPIDVLIPLGVEQYIIEYSINSSPWVQIGKTTSKTYTHYIPEVSGPTQYRVKAIDKNNRLESDYIYTSNIMLDFLPPLPLAPNPTASPDYKWIDVKWPAVTHADSYEIYIGNSLDEAKKKNGWHITTTNTNCRMSNLAENTTYKITVIAINRRGTAQKSINSKTKQQTPKTLVIKPLGHKVYREAYRPRYPWGYANWVGAGWRYDTTDIMQAEWVETWPDGWAWRSNGLYQAYKGQAWGNNRSCLIFNYNDIINKLKGKRITSVEFSLRRTSTIHGWPTGNPIHMCSHNETSPNKTGGRPSMFNLKTSGYSVARGNYVYVNDGNTKFVLQQIIDGKARGLGFFKSYPGKTPEGDKAYLRFGKDFSMTVTYFDS